MSTGGKFLINIEIEIILFKLLHEQFDTGPNALISLHTSGNELKDLPIYS